MDVKNSSVEYDTCWKYSRTITDDISTDEQQKIKRKFEFLRDIINDGLYNGLLNVGPKGFDRFTMYHTGEAWAIKLEAEVPK